MKLLAPIGYLYGRFMQVRNALYDRGVLRPHDLGVKTISIGNLTAGGTGKTPLAAMIASILAAKGEHVCILTRGYGRKDPGKRVLVSDGTEVLADALTGGDEPAELARKLLGKAAVVADADRIAAAAWARTELRSTVFILDDGFQHRRAARDLDIVCIDATDPLGGGVIPAGKARERIEGLTRADAMVITRADLVGNIRNVRDQVSAFAPNAEIFLAENQITDVLLLSEFHDGTHPAQVRSGSNIEMWKQLQNLKRAESPDTEVRVYAFCALGNPESFFRLLEGKSKNGAAHFDLVVQKAFPDHYSYTQNDVDRLETQARECRIDAFLTTAKDAVKLTDLKFAVPCYVVEIEPTMDDPVRFAEMIISS